MNRRRFLKTVALTGMLSSLPATMSRAQSQADNAIFQHGVASGDPSHSGALLWTRVSGFSEAVSVGLEVARDPHFAQVIYRAMGESLALPRNDFTVHVDFAAVEPGTTFYFRFWVGDVMSPVGRSHSLPADDVQHVRFGVATCAKYTEGYYHAYADLAQRADLDAIIHLGDYIYESRSGDNALPGRAHTPPHEAVTLDDYRNRYRQYRRDAMLQAMHRQHPIIAVWDDHEFTDNAYINGAANHDASEGDWPTRRDAALKAWLEWMPVRQPEPDTSPLRIYRSLRYGDLLSLHMLDTRIIGREQQLPDAPTLDELYDPMRSLLGDAQRTWLYEGLQNSTARWKLVGNQVLMSPVLFNTTDRDILGEADVWDGYRAEQSGFFNFLAEHGLDNVVIMTGDLHTSAANDLPQDITTYNPANDRPVAVEVVAPPIASNTLPNLQSLEPMLMQFNPHLRFIDFRYRGHMIVDITAERVQTDWFFVADANLPHTHIFPGQHWYSLNGENRLQPATEPSAAKSNPPSLAD